MGQDEDSRPYNDHDEDAAVEAAARGDVEAVIRAGGTYAQLSAAMDVRDMTALIAGGRPGRPDAVLALRREAESRLEAGLAKQDAILRDWLRGQSNLVTAWVERQTEYVARELETNPWTFGDIVQLGATPTPLPSVLPFGDRPGLFYRGQRNMLSGEAAVGKTWAALYAAVLEIAAGQTVVWIDADNMGPARLLERLRLLAGAVGVDDAALAERFRYVRPDAPAGPKSIATLAEAEPSLVVFDSLNPILGLQGVDTASTTEVDSFFRTVLDPLTDPGACALLLDHVPKDKGNRGRYAYGSERKLTGVDVHLTMRAHKPFSREYGGESFVDVAKDRDGHVGATGETVAAFTLETFSSFGGVAQARVREVSAMEADLTLSVLAEQIAGVLSDGQPRTGRWIEDNTTGARATAKREALELLQARGHVTVARGPHNRKEITLVQPYTLTEDGPLGGDE